MNLELQLSAFTGYGKADEDAYLGLQAHGILWVADPTQAPVNWPIAPPIVAGKVLLHSTCMPAIACLTPTHPQPHGPVRVSCSTMKKGFVRRGCIIIRSCRFRLLEPRLF